MATKNITGLNTESILVKAAGTTYNITKGATVIAGGTDPSAIAAIMDDQNLGAPVKNITVNVDGSVAGYQAAIYLMGANARVNISNTGEISGVYGVAVGGNNARVVNDGAFTSSMYGLAAMGGENSTLQNNGSITAAVGIFAQGADDIDLINGARGTIIGMQYGLAVDLDPGDTARIVNHGKVQVTYDVGFAVRGSDGDETVINDGVMLGSVDLSGGNDILDNRGGTIKGSIIGDFGDDTLIVDSAKTKLVESTGEGTDTIKSTVSYTLSANVEKLFLLGNKDIEGNGNVSANILHGNAGDNILRGKAGIDNLFGHKGNDRLFGGTEADIFHFSKGDGNDKVMDFETTIDDIDLSGWAAISDFATLFSHAKNDGDGNVVIKVGTDSLTIVDMVKGDLDANDFIYPI